MVGTVTGKDARIYMVSHQAGTLSWTNKSLYSYDTYGIGDFTLTFGSDIIDQPLVGQAGPYRVKGPITCDGTMTLSKFGGSMDVIHECCRGIPRLINILCDYIMLTALWSKRQPWMRLWSEILSKTLILKDVLS
jgi:hypothetical protein